MIDELEEDYPEAVQYIRQAVDEHGEQWVLDHYHVQIKPLQTFIPCPDVEELPFYNEYETLDREEHVEHAEMLREYRENLRTQGQEDG
jgi:alkanesulfonate monooxygenase SsuD/methylene tetrahydromethanopterin reductase-like flavin-dependent oxidoreductase (luciferase family)